jgi:signal transduction histidine kinase
MLRSGRFERRLLIALVLFSVIPTLVLVGLGTIILGEAVSLQTTPAGWERLGETGRVLLERAEGASDPVLVEAAQAHRQELTTSIQQAQRWGYLNRQALETLPWIATVFFLTLVLLAIRSARRIARSLASPIDELVGWSQRVARDEPLPLADVQPPEDSGDFAILRDSFRTMEREVRAARAREVETARVRASVALARGVAHELKNSLTPLRLAVRTLRSNRTLDGATAEPLDVIDAESNRLEGLARAFSQFGRAPEGPRSAVDLVELLTYIGRTHVPKNISFRLEPSAPEVWVEGYYDALSRALVNLVLNAVEAMGERGGSLAVSLGETDAGKVGIRIADSGPGLPAGSEQRLWDPDFTTKPRGTGLGLALVRQTIHAHGGEVIARTAASGGAEFEIVFPRSQAPGPDPLRAVTNVPATA